MTTIYEKYQLNKVINESGKMTALRVSKYLDEALEAQQFGGKYFFEMDQLNINVGKYIADLVGAEDAHIVSSAADGIAQSIAVLIGEGSRYHVHNPYTDKTLSREVILHKGHNVDFGASISTLIELGGVIVVEALKEGSPAINIRNHQLNMGIFEFDIRSVVVKEMKRIVSKLEKIIYS